MYWKKYFEGLRGLFVGHSYCGFPNKRQSCNNRIRLMFESFARQMIKNRYCMDLQALWYEVTGDKHYSQTSRLIFKIFNPSEHKAPGEE